MRHYLGVLTIGVAALLATPHLTSAQTKTRLSIATGGTGGVYYPLGGGLAALISKHIQGVEATVGRSRHLHHSFHHLWRCAGTFQSR